MYPERAVLAPPSKRDAGNSRCFNTPRPDRAFYGPVNDFVSVREIARSHGSFAAATVVRRRFSERRDAPANHRFDGIYILMLTCRQSRGDYLARCLGSYRAPYRGELKYRRLGIDTNAGHLNIGLGNAREVISRRATDFLIDDEMRDGRDSVIVVADSLGDIDFSPVPARR